MNNFDQSLIFISYRRSETSGETGRMLDYLKTVIDEKYFFLDIDSIGGGEKFPVVLKKAIEQCEVFIPVIGPNWLSKINTAVESDTTDYVRTEIATALKKKKQVLPVLVNGAKMPTGDQLPKDLKGLEFYNAADLSYTRWQYDMDKIIQTLSKKGIPLKTETRRSEKKVIGWMVVGVVVVLGLFIGVKDWLFKKEPTVPVTTTRSIPFFISGEWKPLTQASNKLMYTISQSGSGVTVQQFVDGVLTNTGTGTLVDRKLSIRLKSQSAGEQLITLTLAPGNNKLTGSRSLGMKVGTTNIGIAENWERVK